MALGYDGKLYILAFDHRGSFQKKMFGIEGDPTAEETETISDAKHLIFEGMLKAAEQGAEPGVTRLPRGRAVRRPARASPRRPRSAGCPLDAGREVRARTSSTSSTATTSAPTSRSSTPTSPRSSSATTPTATPR